MDIMHTDRQTPSELTALLGHVLDTVLRIPGSDCGGIYLVDSETGALDLVCDRGLSPEFHASVSHFSADSLQAKQAEALAPLYYRAAEFEPPGDQLAHSEGIRSLAVLPVAHRGRAIAVLCLASRQHDEILPNARPSMEAIGHLVGEIIARAHVERSLSETETRNRLMLDRALDGFAIMDVDGVIREANPACCAMLGYSRDELVGAHIADVDALDSRQSVAQRIAALRQSGTARFETKQRRKDGQIIDISVNLHYCRCGDADLLFAFVRDVGRERQTERALRETEQRYQIIAENVADIIWTAEFDISDAEWNALADDPTALANLVMQRWRFTFVSSSVKETVGYSPDESRSVLLTQLFTATGLDFMQNALIARLSGSEADAHDLVRHQFLETAFVRKDGSIGWCEAASTPIRNEQGRIVGFLGVTRDISKRHKAEAALRESEVKLRALLENLPDIVVLLDKDAKILFINRGVGDVDPATLVHVDGLDFIMPEHHHACRNAFDKVLATSEPQVFEALDVYGYWRTCRIAPIMKEGALQCVIAICTDITEQRVAAEAVQKEQQLLRRLLDLHERDRQLMAYEIHDGFVQHLAGALFRLQAFHEMLSHEPTAAWESHNMATRLVRNAIDDARRLISGLRPPILDEAGIVDAIEYLVCESRQATGLEIEFNHDVAFGRLAPPLETAIFRIVQESLRNACRHSGSQRISIELTQRDQTIYLEVRDWGIGFLPERVAEQRFGLQGIRERVRLLGGRIAIESAANEGTRICAELSLVAHTDDLATTVSY